MDKKLKNLSLIKFCISINGNGCSSTHTINLYSRGNKRNRTSRNDDIFCCHRLVSVAHFSIFHFMRCLDYNKDSLNTKDFLTKSNKGQHLWVQKTWIKAFMKRNIYVFQKENTTVLHPYSIPESMWKEERFPLILTTIVPTPVRMSTPKAFIEFVRFPRIRVARLLAWSATACLSYPALSTWSKSQDWKKHHILIHPTWSKQW